MILIQNHRFNTKISTVQCSQGLIGFGLSSLNCQHTLKTQRQLTSDVYISVNIQTDRPKYMNYGAIGSVVGHEITHGFDDQGSQRDENGNLVNWWDPKTKQKFLVKAQCIIGNHS